MPHRIFPSKIVTTLLSCPRPAPIIVTDHQLRVENHASPCHAQPSRAGPSLYPFKTPSFAAYTARPSLSL